MSNTTTAKAPNYAYLAEKDPSSLHHALKAFIEDHGGPEVDIKTIQAVLSAHGTFQKSDYNKNREEYKARTAASIYKGGVTTSKRFEWVINPETGEEEQVEVQAPKAEEAPKAPAAKKAPARRTPAKAAAPKAEAPAAPKKAPVRRTRTTKAPASK